MTRGSRPEMEEAPDVVVRPADPGREQERPAPTLTEQQRAGLLEVARLAVATAVGACPFEAVADAANRTPPIDATGGVFVTLTVDGELRGCAGTLESGQPLAAATVQAAIWAANDPRFLPLTATELDAIDLEVSVLGPMVRLHDPMAFVLGVDGVVVQRGGRRGLLLPEVASHHALDRGEMLEIAARKAGLPPDAAGDPQTVVYAFRTLRFGAPHPARDSTAKVTLSPGAG